MRVAMLTGGGDCPGLNAVMRAVARKGERVFGDELIGFVDGWRGVIDGETRPLSVEALRGSLPRGGTILGTSRTNPFKIEGGVEQARATLERLGIDALIAIGGDDTLGVAAKLFEMGVHTVGVPKTIDNDVSGTISTFGFDTAVNTAIDAIDKLHTTAESHDRVIVLEVMGRNAGFIALHSGLAGTADVILIPEIPYDIDKVCERLMENEIRGKRYGIVVVAEGAKARGGGLVTKENVDVGRQEVMLGGVAETVAREIHQRTGKETRSLVLGHLQRGGSPTTWDRLISIRFGAAAVRFIAEGKRNVMVAWQPPEMRAIPVVDVICRTKTVPTDSDTVQTCRDLGVCFGE